MCVIAKQTAWIGNITSEHKICFLARLSFEMTIAGRDSYEAGTDDLANPRLLRRINAIQYRVTTCLSQLLTGTCTDGFDRSMPEWVMAEPDVELRRILEGTWASAKRHVQA